MALLKKESISIFKGQEGIIGLLDLNEGNIQRDQINGKHS